VDQHDKSVQQRKTLSPRQQGALSTELRETRGEHLTEFICDRRPVRC